jgi:8-oxo-dGTP pyrophosphatase MutT (NUDIX family)
MSSYSKHNTSTIIRKKSGKDMICTNCGCKRHTYKQCTEPVTSWGVILVTFGDLKKPHHDRMIDLSRFDMSETETRVLVETKMDRMIVSSAYHTIKFLMISRKHSVGYVEFIRGRYRPEKIDQVIYLFKQMMQSEINDINYSLTIDDGFEYLWKKFWRAKANSPYLANDKKVSKDNFKMLRTKGVEGPELDLEYIVSTVRAEYDIEEWGFPKGRKNRFETDEACAVREFKEESGYDDDDFKIIKNIAPLIEEFNGTNGVRYRHVYYIAELTTEKSPRNNVTESQKDEIGNIQFMDFTTALEYIRDYHMPRKILLQKLFTYYLDRLVLSNRHGDHDVYIDHLDVNELDIDKLDINKLDISKLDISELGVDKLDINELRAANNSGMIKTLFIKKKIADSSNMPNTNTSEPDYIDSSLEWMNAIADRSDTECKFERSLDRDSPQGLNLI